MKPDASRRTTILLMFFGALAVSLAIFRESDWMNSPSTEELRREEIHRLVSAAQLWFARPAIRGGGAGSFETLTFAALGLGEAGDDSVWQGETARFEIGFRTKESFLLRASNPAGTVFFHDTLSFDSYPGSMDMLR